MNNKTMLNNINSNNNNQVSYATFLLTKNNKKKELGFKGKTARALLSLVNAKNKGITTFDGFTMDLHRMSEFVRIFRHEHNINIITMREQLPNSWRGRYVLADMVEIGKVFEFKTKQNPASSLKNNQFFSKEVSNG